MRDRKKQRELKKAGVKKNEKPWLNSEGYHDPTAYQAIRNLEKERTAGPVPSWQRKENSDQMVDVKPE